jgi:general secretion pathway protein D
MPPPLADAPSAVQPGAGQPIPFNRDRRPAPDSLTFADADIAAVANEILGAELKIPFLIDPGVTGKVSFRVDRRLTHGQLLEAFEAALALGDVALVRTDSHVVLMPRAKARALAPFRRISSDAGRVQAGFQSVSVPVAFVSPTDAAKSIQASNPAIAVQADDGTGALLIAGSSGEIRSALATIRSIDHNQMSRGLVRTIPLRSASPSAVSGELSKLLTASGASGVSVVPIDRLNELIVTAQSPMVLDEAEEWVERLDQPSHEETTSLWVYRPQNVSAEALAQALNDLIGGHGGSRGKPAASSPPTMSGAPQAPSLMMVAPGADIGDQTSALPADPDLRVSVEKDTNTLIVMAPQSRWMTLKPVLDQIDQAPAQILIEATVLEVTLDRDFQTGVNWSVLGTNGVSVTSTQINAATAPSQLALTFMNNSVQVAIDALASRTNVQVVSAPKLVAVDNQAATLQVGDEVPIIDQTAQSTSAPGAPIVANTEYKDTGIILKIKPRINGPRSVLVDFSQEVSSVVPTTSSTINSPTIQQRRFESQMTLAEGETVAVGGLISTNKTDSQQGWPGLKDIPVIGLMFKGQQKNNDRTEIIVLLSAHILRSDEQEAKTLDLLKSEMPTIKARGLGVAP